MNPSHILFPSKVIFNFIAVCLCILPAITWTIFRSYWENGFEGSLLCANGWFMWLASYPGYFAVAWPILPCWQPSLTQGRESGWLPSQAPALVPVVVLLCLLFNKIFDTTDSRSPSAKTPLTPLQSRKRRLQADGPFGWQAFCDDRICAMHNISTKKSRFIFENWPISGKIWFYEAVKRIYEYFLLLPPPLTTQRHLHSCSCKGVKGRPMGVGWTHVTGPLPVLKPARPRDGLMENVFLS